MRKVKIGKMSFIGLCKEHKGLMAFLLVGGLILALAAMAPGAWATPNQNPLRDTVPEPEEIVGFVYCDLDGDCEYDEGVDYPLVGTTVILDPGTGQQKTTITDANGTYRFTNLVPGSSHIVEILGKQQAATAGGRVDFCCVPPCLPVPVGGYAWLPNRFELLAPWVGLAALIGVMVAAVVVRLRRQG